MFLIPFKPGIPRLCTYTFQTLQSWWYLNFTSEIMSLLGIAGLGILILFCHLSHNLYHFEKKLFDSDRYGAVYDVGSKLYFYISLFLPSESTCRPSYNYRPPRCHCSRRSGSSGSYNSFRHCPQDERRNKSGIHNRRGQYRYFRNRYHRADSAPARRSNPGHSDKEPTSHDQPPIPTPTFSSLYLSWRYSSFFIYSSQIYYRSTAKYYSWMRKRRRRKLKPKPPDDLDDWVHGNDWIPTVIINNINLPSYDEYYDNNYPFHRTAFVLGHRTCPSAGILSKDYGNPPQKVRSGVKKRQTKPVKLPSNALIMDSGANVHIINNPSFYYVSSCVLDNS